ncbi:MAG: OmpA family protein [Deltaproteobacteria bacterium]|nr:OmpA family protein [Deltaproteobacteria bacterium]
MRRMLIAGVILLAAAAACAGAPKTTRSAKTTPAAGPAPAKPADVQVKNDSPAPPKAKPAEKTEAQLADEEQDRLGKKKSETDAQDSLARLGAVTAEDRGMVITFVDTVLFAPEEVALLPAAQPLMNKVADALLVNKERDLVVEGHTDTSGEVSRNIELSRQRAEAVRNYLIAQGYPAARIRAQGIGQDRPVGTNSSSKGRALNRRMEIVVSFNKDASL